MFSVTIRTPTVGLKQVKCDQYWPGRGTETYGMFQVAMLDTVELATYTIRTFALYKVTMRIRMEKVSSLSKEMKQERVVLKHIRTPTLSCDEAGEHWI